VNQDAIAHDIKLTTTFGFKLEDFARDVLTVEPLHEGDRALITFKQ